MLTPRVHKNVAPKLERMLSSQSSLLVRTLSPNPRQTRPHHVLSHGHHNTRHRTNACRRRRNDSSSLVSEQSSAAFSKSRDWDTESALSLAHADCQLACAAWRFTYFWTTRQPRSTIEIFDAQRLIRLNG